MTRHAWCGAIALMVCGAGSAGCAQIATRSETSERVFFETSYNERSGPWTYRVIPTPDATSDDLRLLVQQTQECDVVTQRSGERTEHRIRENQTAKGTVVAGAIGVLGASALAWGLSQNAKGEPLTKKEGENREFTPVGLAVFFGSIGSLGLVTATHGALASIDTTSSAPFKEEARNRRVCQTRSVSGVVAQLYADEKLLAEAETDQSGQATFACLLGRLQTSPGTVRILVAGGIAEQAAELPRLGAGGATKPAARDKSGYEPAPLQLFDVPVRRARRDDLTAAIVRSGGKLVDEADHVSNFDITGAGWPHATSLKLLFDGDGMFVKAKWEGDFSGTRRSDLISALSSRFGAPGRQTSDSGDATLLWRFGDGLEVRQGFSARDRSPCPRTELVYVDPAALTRFEAAVRQAGNNP